MTVRRRWSLVVALMLPGELVPLATARATSPARTGVAVQLPLTGPADQTNSGTEVTVDAKHHLFLVAEPVYRPTGTGAIVVYDEQGNFVEAIRGFHFSPTPGRIAVNPPTRTGWTDGPAENQLQQFFY